MKAGNVFDWWDNGLQAPQFATDARARKTQHKSHEELEAEEMAAMPHFRAKALKYASAKWAHKHQLRACHTGTDFRNNAQNDGQH